MFRKKKLINNEITQDNINRFLDDVIYANFCTPEKNIDSKSLIDQYFSNVVEYKNDITKFVESVNEETKELSSSVITCVGNASVWYTIVSRIIHTKLKEYLNKESKKYDFGKFVQKYSKNLKNKFHSNSDLALPKSINDELAKRKMQYRMLANTANMELENHLKYYKEILPKYEENIKNLNNSIQNSTSILKDCKAFELLDMKAVTKLQAKLDEVKSYMSSNIATSNRKN